MASEPVRYGVLGLGRAGWSIHIRQLRDREDAVVAAVADPVEQRRQEAKDEFDCATYATLEEMLADENVEVVVVATPSITHPSDSIAALEAGKHVVCEKPMATSVEDADAMIAASRKAGRALFIHQNYRFHGITLFLQELIASGKIGEPFHLRFQNSGFRRRNDWQTLRKNGGGLLNNNTIHFLDTILLVLDSPTVSVMGDLRQIASPGDVEDHVKALLRLESGATADIEISMAEAFAEVGPTWSLAGTHGGMVSDGKTATVRWYDPKDAPPIEVIEGAVAGRAYGNDDELPWQEETVDVPEGMEHLFYDNVFDVVRDGAAMTITPESCREVLRVIAAIRKGTPFE